MNCKISLLITVFFCTFLSAQTGRLSLSGKLDIKDKVRVIHIQNIDGINIPMPIDTGGRFSLVIDNLQNGFYEIEKIGTVYLSSGCKLSIIPDTEGAYIFTGTGALENNAYRNAKAQLKKFLSLDKSGELLQPAYYLDVAVFLQKLDSFQQNGDLLFRASNDTFFHKYAVLDLAFYSNNLLYYYYAFYGIDREKINKVTESLTKLGHNDPGFIMKMMKLVNSTHVKTMSTDDRQQLTDLLYNKWDKTDETLLRNSVWYRQAFQRYFTMLSYNQKYFDLTKLIVKSIDIDIKTLAIARDELHNAYIFSYFDYILTSSILKKTRDTTVLNEFYNGYVTRSKQLTYLSAVKKIYSNAVSYTDNTVAPFFSYSDVSGNPVTLENFAGKYVYIDVWATWCGPCINEIPYLKKLEAAYQNKNIQFVSISVDEQSSFDKWKAFVKKNDLTGIQLIADNAFDSPFIEKMNITSIPRFILIDPSGKLIDADVLRPSDKKLRTKLDKLLL